MIFFNNQKFELNNFPDHTLSIKCPVTHPKNEIMWLYENDSELFAVACIAKHITNSGNHVSLFMPYIPNARLDRCVKSYDIFTLKHFAEIINSLHFDEVTVLDPHSHVSTALINNVRVLSPVSYISKAIEVIGGIDLLFYPDEGAMKRYSSSIKKPYCFGIKNRDWETGKILGLDLAGPVEDIAGKNILIVDDICSRGGTFLHSARRLKEVGAEDIYLFVSHCENTILQGELLDGDLVKRVYTTNSIFTKSHPKIEVINLV